MQSYSYHEFLLRVIGNLFFTLFFNEGNVLCQTDILFEKEVRIRDLKIHHVRKNRFFWDRDRLLVLRINFCVQFFKILFKLWKEFIFAIHGMISVGRNKFFTLIEPAQRCHVFVIMRKFLP